MLLYAVCSPFVPCKRPHDPRAATPMPMHVLRECNTHTHTHSTVCSDIMHICAAETNGIMLGFHADHTHMLPRPKRPNKPLAAGR